MASLLDAVTPTRATWNGGNVPDGGRPCSASTGSTNAWIYGGLDRELGERLVNAGVRGRQIRHRAIAVHLDHSRPYVKDESWRCNEAIRRETRRNRSTWTFYGIETPLRLFPAEDSRSASELPGRRAAA